MTKLYTDTSANLPLALLREYDIAVIPFSYTVNGVAEDYSEETDFDGKAFYDAMRRGVEVKTSMVNPATAAAFFERALAQGDDVLYVGMSGGISGTAHRAVERRAVEIHIIGIVRLLSIHRVGKRHNGDVVLFRQRDRQVRGRIGE